MNIQTQNKINKRLSLAEIYQDYPNQWVLVIEPQLDDDLNIIDGEVAYSGNQKSVGAEQCSAPTEVRNKTLSMSGFDDSTVYLTQLHTAINFNWY
jgi:hypothetical protein